jgi:ubiquinol-cytochrome c reductase iron-sulfur subunit
LSDEGINKTRRNFLIGATSVVGSVGVAGVAVPFIGSWNPSAKALAAGAPIKVDVSRLEPGDMLGPIPAWRDKPVFIVKRTDAMVAALGKTSARLADPDSVQAQQPDYARNEGRSIRPDLLVLVGICTHLGCSPKFNPEVTPQEYDPDWLGGFYCPCHGSKFDLAGRVYSGVPAPTNLEVPPYFYENDTVLVIGKDKGAA